MLHQIAIYSSLMSLEKAKRKLSNTFEENSNINFTSTKIEDFTSDFTIIYILTGGVEGIAKDIINHTRQKVTLVALENDNALPAGYELKAYFDNDKVDLIYVAQSQMKNNIEKSMQEINERINVIRRTSEIYDSINEAKFGVIGGISDWLINSQAQPFPQEFDIQPLEIRLTELMTIYRETEVSEIQHILAEWEIKYNLTNIDMKEVEKSAKLYFALQEIVNRYNLTALTIKCFDLLPFKVTACLALAELNDIGIIAGCEGDTQALFTLFLAKNITSEIPWMANISDINIQKKTIQLAHCTVPTCFLSKKDNITLDTHMESDLSLAISGEVPLGKVTIIRIGKSLTQHYIMEGEVIASNMGNKDICRTQSIIKINETGNWHNKLVGNHQIVIQGHHKKRIREFLDNISQTN